MRYKNFSYLYPPRPEQATPRSDLNFFESRDYRAQVKKNGTCSVLAISPDKEIVAMNRHNQTHKLWTPKPALMRPFTTLPGDGWYVFVAELLHSKVEGIRDINYVHDVLVADGDYLVGETHDDRFRLLHEIFLSGNEEETYSHYVVDDKTWIARQYEEGFGALYDSVMDRDAPEDEGIVLKPADQRLNICSKAKANIAGMVKCRKSHKNFSF